ncbi:zeta toxin family protein [Lysobacter sp. CA199]|uniref:zeta toxin family protein n=1 Tax=Lysobacter sp. CA199 TaxID=3455608 RepID=UPI003F8D6860
MNSQEGGLDKQTSEGIFFGQIVPDSGMDAATSHSQPKAIILAAQPGAGKSSLLGMARADLADDLVIIDADRLRSYYPQVSDLRSAGPYTWSVQTDIDAAKWAAALCQAAVRSRKNLIIDTTLSDGESTAEQIRMLRANGYEVEMRAIAAHRLESELGVDRRFLSGFLRDGYGPYQREASHAQSYENMPGSLNYVREQTQIPIRIFNRDGMLLYDGRTDPAMPGVALDQARETRLKDPKLTKTLKEYWQMQQALHRDLPEILARMSSN